MYTFDEELQYALHYANKLADKEALKILALGDVKNTSDATALSLFFWNMVAASIADELSETQLHWTESAEFLNNKIQTSFSSYLMSEGYTDEWTRVTEQH